MNLLEDKLHWLTNQGQYLAEIDRNIENYQKALRAADAQIQTIGLFDKDHLAVDAKISVSIARLKSKQGKMNEMNMMTERALNERNL